MEVFKLFGEIVVKAKDAIDTLNDTAKEAEKTGEASKEIGEGFTKSGKVTKKKLEEIAKLANKTTDEIKNEAEKLAKSYVEAGMDSKDAMKKAYADIEESAKETTKGTEKFGRTAIESFGKVATAAGAVVSAVIAIGKAMIDIANDTREYRVEMAKLETAFTAAGHSTESATAAYQELQAVLGEADQAVEASNHLAKLCRTEEELRALTNACVGVYATFGASLPIEGLTEAANETAKTGALTGQLADALNWAGASEVEFQESLNACNSESERAELITAKLVDLYGEIGETYKKNNKDILDSVGAQEKFNAAMARLGEVFEPVATAWYEFLASFTNFTADAIEGAYDPVNVMAESFSGVQETAEGAAAKVAELKAKIQEYDELPAWMWNESTEVQYHALMSALFDATNQYNELAEAEEQAAIEAQNATDPEITEAFTTATEQYVADATALLTKFEETYSQVFGKVTGWFAPFEAASVKVNTSIGQMIEGMQSQIEFNKQYSENLQYLKEQGLGGLADAFQDYGAEGSAYAQTVASALQQAGGSATEEGQKIIAEFQAISDAQLQSQEELANSLTLANGEIEAEMQSLTENYAEKVAELDMSAEALTSAQNTMSGFLKGITNGVPGILEKMSNLGKQMTQALQNSIGPIQLTIQATLNSASNSYSAFSVDTVSAPRNTQSDYVTKGSVANAGGGVVINQYIDSVAQTPVELAAATEAYFVQARWAMA